MSRREVLRCLSAIVPAGYLWGYANTAIGSVMASANGDSIKNAIYLLNRWCWGPSPQDLTRFLQQGQAAFLQGQFSSSTQDDLPPRVAARIRAMKIESASLPELYAASREAAAQSPNAEQRKKAFRAAASTLLREAEERAALRAVHSTRQLEDRLTWFWLNHFSVYRGKANIAIFLADYEKSIRARVFGKFKNLLQAAVLHPAMLVYLDNNQNKVGKINENLARELMELHTLGVDGGYSQDDVRNLAGVLTGLEVDFFYKKKNHTQSSSGFESEMTRMVKSQHDSSEKMLLGKPVRGRGQDEVFMALDMLAGHPSTAKHISTKLVIFFVSDRPPASLVETCAHTFLSTDGDLPSVLRTIFSSQEFSESLGRKAKLPVAFIYSAFRMLATRDANLAEASVINSYLSMLGQPLFGCMTPNGYALTADQWLGPGQLTQRFDVARAIAATKIRDNKKQRTESVEGLSNVLLSSAIGEKIFSQASLAAIRGSKSKEEELIYLMASPEFNRE